jgi:hypothetical protein
MFVLRGFDPRKRIHRFNLNLKNTWKKIMLMYILSGRPNNHIIKIIGLSFKV